MKPLARAKELAKQATLAPVITEETDKDAHLNKTLNPVINETDILTALEMRKRLGSIPKLPTPSNFIYNMTRRKKTSHSKNKFPKLITNTSNFLTKTRLIDFPNLDHGITKSS